jgi:signal transduction histidine kinase/ligand-binding sensor domain-containing protein
VGPDQSVLGLSQDPHGTLWIATVAGVYRRSADDEFLRVDAISPSNNLWADLAFDEAGNGWTTDFRQGFRRISDQTRPGTLPQPFGWGARLLADSRNTLWVATQGQGLWRVRPPTVRGARPEVEVIDSRSGLPSNGVQALAEDADGAIWVGTSAGLVRLTPKRVSAFSDLGIPRAIESTNDGSVWVGTTAGLIRYSKLGRTDYTERNGLPSAIVLALYADAAGVLWIATTRGIVKFDKDRFTDVPSYTNSSTIRISGLSHWRNALVLLEREQGLLLLDRGVIRSLQIPELARNVSIAYADREGNLWAVFGERHLGVLRANGPFKGVSIDVGRIRAICQDTLGAVWVGGEQGLARIDRSGVLTAGRRNGFPGTVTSLVEDGEGALWMGLDSGIVRLARSEFVKTANRALYQMQYRSLNTTDGVAGRPTSIVRQSAVRASDGRLWFITTAGVTIVDPDRLGAPPPPPRVRIEGMIADAQPVESRPDLVLRAGTTNVQIAFAALALADPTRVRFQYRLDGFDATWIDAGSSRQVSYTNLPPRSYTFRVMASAAGSDLAGSTVSLPFAIAPAIHQRRSIQALAALGGMLVVVVAWRLRVRQVRHQVSLVLGERLRMSRTIHDTLLQGFVGMALRCDDISHDLDSSPAAADTRLRLAGMRREIQTYVREARRAILELRSPMLQPGALPVALREVCEHVIGGKPIALELTVSGAELRIPPHVVEQLLLIGQEAVRNAVRHSHASRIRLGVTYQKKELRLHVSDDGCGFEPDAIDVTSHFGLITMKERTEQVQGRFRIETRLGTGTQIEAVVPAH